MAKAYTVAKPASPVGRNSMKGLGSGSTRRFVGLDARVNLFSDIAS